MKRRKFLKRLAQLSGIGALTGMYAWQIEPFWLEFVKIKMLVKNLPAHLVGKTLMQISDMHVGNGFDRKYIIKSLQKAQKWAPDFVVYTGDFITYESPEQFKQLAEVLAHAVLGKMGTLGILGNHDYGRSWSDSQVAHQVASIAADKGIAILRNAGQEIAGLHFTGLDDYWGTNYAPHQILAGIDPDKANIVLCHNPDVADEPVWGHYSDWILSGHTHGGQCKPPFLDPPLLPVQNTRYSAGKIDLAGGRTLYVNRALGHLLQVRFNVRPEITIFELQKASEKMF